MRRLASALILSLALLPQAHAEDNVQYPLGQSRIMLRKGTVTFDASWTGPRGTVFNPQAVTSTIAIAGGTGQADGSPVTLVSAKWKVLKKSRGYKYTDRSGSAGGIKSVVLRMTASGGKLKVRGGSGRFAYTADGKTPMTVTLSIGTARWCAVFSAPLQKIKHALLAKSSVAPDSCPCVGSGTSTWQAIQTNIIERYGCAASSCHSGASPQNGLDLSPAVAFQNLVGVPSVADPSLLRVKRADRTHSLFWLKLAKSTIGGEYANVPGTGMPNNGLKLTTDELEAVRLWIQAGAPEDGVVAGTDKLLSACLPPPDPIKITPPDPPAATDGVQLYGPPWNIPPKNETVGRNGENEICQATYYDFSATVPDNVKLSRDDPRCRYWTAHCSDNVGKHCFTDADCGAATCQSGDECFFMNRSELTQDPNSHHSIIHIYRGQFRPGDQEYTDGFGPFTCRAGANAGAACDITRTDQCPGSVCAGRVQQSIACVFYGPSDFGFDITGTGSDNSPNIGGSQQPYDQTQYPPGVYGVFPVRGTVVWNSHAFNVTDQPTTNEQWLNVFFAKNPSDRVDMVRGIFDSRYIFTQDVPPFEKREYCATFTLPQGARVFELSSHTHKRGLLWRTWLPPNQSCTPCDPPKTGFTGCATPNPGCAPNATSPLVTTTTYNDPAHYLFDTPLPLDDPNAANRTLKYCSVFDNGATDPSTVKRNSSSPPTPFGVSAVVPGGPCYAKSNTGQVIRDRVACMDGPHRGQPCHGDDRSCDSAPGANDGVCDACPLVGGVTTEDEMYILLGFWYWPGH